MPASAGTAGEWVFGAGKCRGIAIWVPANAGLRKHFYCREVPREAFLLQGSAGKAFLVQGSARGSIFSASKCRGQTSLPPPHPLLSGASPLQITECENNVRGLYQCSWAHK